MDTCGESNVVEVSFVASDCGSDDASHNVCLEAAGFPISTSPELLKMMEANTESEVLVDAEVERAWSEATEQIEVRYVFQIVKPQKPKPFELSCSAIQAECEQAPRIPTLELPTSESGNRGRLTTDGRYIEPVSFDMTANGTGVAFTTRSLQPPVPPPDSN